ncbi:MAG: menaquinone biosynthesis protein [Planctomycetaceae bacterium]|jgi:chorismate dehydratase|nr:menaquinone biosynthesis protein [Planctomycetaceae bacterium]
MTFLFFMKICSVPYYNTLPLTWFLDAVFPDLTLTTDYPAKLADRLRRHDCDIAMMPVGSLPGLEEGTLIGDICLGCRGAVGSVLLFSRKSPDEIRTLALDSDSRTSAVLGQILLKHYYGNPDFQTQPLSRTDSLENLAADACLVIGDRALTYPPENVAWPMRFDLGELWLRHTGLPFVFAAWITANRDIAGDAQTAMKLGKARDLGIQNLAVIAQETVRNQRFGNTLFTYPVTQEQLLRYYRENMVYLMTDAHRRGLQLYFELGKRYHLFV